jgi:hypothetical protein
VVVRGVNDLPEIRMIGDVGPPFDITVDERTNTLLPITVYDEEATGIYYSLESEWDGVIVLQNGTLSIVAGSDDIGTHPVTLTVEDADGGIASVEFDIVVSDVNDPPGKIFVLSPASGTSVPHGTNVTFSVDVRDPDGERGQEVTVVWTSSKDGELRSITGRSGFSFTTSELEPGRHVITITASDGMLESRTTIELTVKEPTNDGGGAGLAGENTYLVLMLVVLAILVLVTLGLVYMGRKADGDSTDGGPGGEV